MAQQTQTFDLETRYDALSHQSILWIDSHGKAHLINEMPLRYVDNVAKLLDREGLMNTSHPLCAALTARWEELREAADEQDDDEQSDNPLDDILKSDEIPTGIKVFVKALSDAGLVAVKRV